MVGWQAKNVTAAWWSCARTHQRASSLDGENGGCTTCRHPDGAGASPPAAPRTRGFGPPALSGACSLPDSLPGQVAPAPGGRGKIGGDVGAWTAILGSAAQEATGQGRLRPCVQ